MAALQQLRLTLALAGGGIGGLIRQQAGGARSPARCPWWTPAAIAWAPSPARPARHQTSVISTGVRLCACRPTSGRCSSKSGQAAGMRACIIMCAPPLALLPGMLPPWKSPMPPLPLWCIPCCMPCASSQRRIAHCWHCTRVGRPRMRGAFGCIRVPMRRHQGVHGSRNRHACGAPAAVVAAAGPGRSCWQCREAAAAAAAPAAAAGAGSPCRGCPRRPACPVRASCLLPGPAPAAREPPLQGMRRTHIHQPTLRHHPPRLRDDAGAAKPLGRSVHAGRGGPGPKCPGGSICWPPPCCMSACCISSSLLCFSTVPTRSCNSHACLVVSPGEHLLSQCRMLRRSNDARPTCRGIRIYIFKTRTGGSATMAPREPCTTAAEGGGGPCAPPGTC